MSKRLFICSATAALLLGAMIGLLADLSVSEVPPALAAVCKAPNGACIPASTTKTSALTVEHKTTNTEPVEPDDGETWNITAYWNTNSVPCSEMTETASVEVSWDGDNWALSNKSLTTHIVGIDVCDASMECSQDEETVHAWGYKLIVDIRDPAATSFNLRQVVYTTTSVDDGYELDPDVCELGSSATANSQTVSKTDTGPFTLIAGRCGYGCSVSGATVTIEY
jgi:hypothetical protein